MAVGNKPALIGTKLQQLYTRGDRFFEIDIDIGSSAVAARVLGLVSYTVFRINDGHTQKLIMTVDAWSGAGCMQRPYC